MVNRLQRLLGWCPLLGEIRSQRGLLIAVLQTSLIVILGACTLDLAVNLLFRPEILAYSLAKTVLISTVLSVLFLTPIGNANLALFRAKEKIEALSQLDSQTGILNRRCFFDRAEALRSEGVASFLVLADIDHFKAINDRLGHPAGDLVLESIGAILRTMFPAPHFAGRIGGEEFALVLSGLTGREAQSLAEFFRLRIAAEHFSAVQQELSITVSIGMARLSAERSVDDAYKEADRQLYRAKREGRNRVEVSRELLPKENPVSLTVVKDECFG